MAGTSTAHTDKMLQDNIGLNTTEVVLGLMVIFIVASLVLSWADKQRQSRILRAVVRTIVIAVSLCCTTLLVVQYTGA
jgi:quinol-cytochrome oxidoreductase complex cytochrome b subunit